jgi:hypothetical protein
MAKIIGIRPSRFTGNDGKEVVGKNIYLTYALDKGEGQGCDRVYMTDKKLADLGREPKVGMDVNIMYNQYGKVADLVPTK